MYVFKLSNRSWHFIISRKYNLVKFLYFSADIFDEIAPAIEEAGLDCECVGGGRILHDSGKRKLEIFGYSQVSSRKKYLNIQSLVKGLSGKELDYGARGQGFKTYLCHVMSLSKTFYSPQVLVIPRKWCLCPDITEKLLTGTNCCVRVLRPTNS